MHTPFGLYLHIPYCLKACSYCDFYFSTQQATRPQLVEALCSELAIRTSQVPDNQHISTVYLGGGTPSLLADAELTKIIDSIRTHYPTLPTAEITLEANPEDITLQRLDFYKQLGINRLSVGIQTFQPETLDLMNRAHSAEQARQALGQVASTFQNWSADLIFGVPGRSGAALEEDIATLLSFQPPHISIYGLTVEPKTALNHWVKAGKVCLDEAQYAREFECVHHLLTAAGYDHYEVSNFAKLGYHAVHNANYWQGYSYLGLGPGAHGFIPPNSRYSNLSSIHNYLADIHVFVMNAEWEMLDVEQLFLEYLITRLRTKQGLDKAQLAALSYTPAQLSVQLQRAVQQGWLTETTTTWQPTLLGWLMLDSLLAHLAG